MTFDRETIYGIVHGGQYTLTETETLQGAKLTSEQRTWWREATILKKANAGKAKDRQSKIDKIVTGGPMTAAERERKMLALRAAIDDVLDDALGRINHERRARTEVSFIEFVKEYGCDDGSFLESPPSKEMEAILLEMQTAVGDSSIPYHIRIARGHGKTSFAKLACIWAAATGRRKFIIVVSATAGDATNIINDISNFFAESPKFMEDYPEVAMPLAALNGVYQRAKSQTYRGRPTKMKLGLGQLVLPTIEGSKASGCILQSAGFSASIRGRVRGKQRPDLLILDDLQTDELANSEERVMEAVLHIKKSFLGLAGHRRKIAAIMTSTPIAPDDLSETFAKDPAWKTTTYKMVRSWPTCWDKNGTNHWTAYRDILEREIAAKSEAPHLAANEYYRTHREEMDAGAEVLNPTNFDASTELSAIQHAMNLLFANGESAFESEYQMAPKRNTFVLSVTASQVASCVRRGVSACTIPPEAVFTVGATDINPSYGLSTVITSFAADLTGLVIAYKIFRTQIDSRINDTAFSAAVTKALNAHAGEIAALGLPLDKWGIDGGGTQFKPVTMFTPLVRDTYGFEAIAMLGRAGQNWNPYVKSRIRDALNDTVTCRGERGAKWIAFNADAYKEKVQRALLTDVGGAGGLSIYDGGADHTKFAIQVSNERIIKKTKMRNPRGNGDQYIYEWKSKNPHDYLDCLAMCYALAGANHLSGDGAPIRTGRHRRGVYTG